MHLNNVKYKINIPIINMKQEIKKYRYSTLKYCKIHWKKNV